MSESLRARSGYALLEAFVIIGLCAIVGAALCSAILMQSRIARAIGERVAFNDAARVTLRVLHAELRLADPARDIRAASSDSVAARWVRASGTVCAAEGGSIWLRLRGMRAPDPAKDSVLLVADTGERAFPLNTLSREQQRCHATSGELVYRLSVGAPPPEGTVALIYESGTYYLSQRAFRYRIGGEGRQPLTDEFMRDSGSRIELMPADTLSAARFRITVSLKPGMQQAGPRSEVRTTILPNAAPLQAAAGAGS